MRRIQRWLAKAAVAGLVLTSPVSVVGAGNPPVAVDDPQLACGSGAFGGTFPIPEDWKAAFSLGPAGPCAPLSNDSDPEGDALSVVLVGQPSHGSAVAMSDGSIRYTVEPNFYTPWWSVPSTTISYRAFDGTSYSNTAAYKLWIAPINDAPSFTPGPGVVQAFANGGAVTVQWATNIKAGPSNESDQAVTMRILQVTKDSPNMFASGPTIDASGVLRFTPGDVPGTATVTVDAKDNGGLEDYSHVWLRRWFDLRAALL